MSDDICICTDCGFQWPRGQHGGHNCLERIKQQLKTVQRQMLSLVDRPQMPNDCTVFEILGKKHRFGVVLVGNKDEVFSVEILDLVEREFGSIERASGYELYSIRNTANGLKLLNLRTGV